MNVELHLLWNVPARDCDALKQATLGAIADQVPRDVRDLWTAFPFPVEVSQMGEQTIARTILESAVAHLNRKRGDQAFALPDGPPQYDVIYVYNNNTVVCVVVSGLLFEGQSWSIADPMEAVEPAVMQLRASWWAGTILPEAIQDAQGEADSSTPSLPDGSLL